jgi:Asp-tRNA(Asn)/Glu-tRNA(Gln) amidotransferase A subunit family amidase
VARSVEVTRKRGASATLRRMLEDLAAAVRMRKVSAEELVRRSLERIERLNPAINAVISVRERAVDEARALDDRIAAGDDPGPLAGIPLLVKDMEDVEGVPTTYGSLLFADAPAAAADGLIPRRLKAAGAIVVGKTNQPEFAFAGFTDNLLYGATRNPWNLEASPGGSSGGSASAMAAGIAPIATATDGGGSIRIPAGWSGLVGLKPTNGVIGRQPIPEWIDLSTFGPLGHSVADVRLLLGIEAGPVPGDPTALPTPLELRADLPSRAFASPRLADYGPLPGPVQELFDAAVVAFERGVGVPVEPIEAERIFRAGHVSEDWLLICAMEHVHHMGMDFCEANLERFSQVFRGVVEFVRRTSFEDYMAARRRRFDYVRELDLLLGDDAVLLTPTNCVEWIRADGTDPRTGEVGDSPDAFNTDPQNMTGHPAISVPAGVSPAGVPFGLEITAPRFRDGMALAAAEAWERTNPWPLVAPGHEPFDV